MKNIVTVPIRQPNISAVNSERVRN